MRLEVVNGVEDEDVEKEKPCKETVCRIKKTRHSESRT
jgi:hypothetical protein